MTVKGETYRIRWFCVCGYVKTKIDKKGKSYEVIKDCFQCERLSFEKYLNRTCLSMSTVNRSV